jgi:protein-S-isoprenylcysteine O-methyltransferase Ste14
MTLWQQQLRAIILLPGAVFVAIPATILYTLGLVRPPFPWNIVLPAIGAGFILVGLVLMVLTTSLFAEVGHGTLAPWNPPRKLVVQGVYRHVRNPMMTGVLCILLGEAVFFESRGLLVWFGVYVLVTVIFIPLVEEPGLARRFGDDYLLYKRHVPRWIPRWRPWEGLSETENLANEWQRTG